MTDSTGDDESPAVGGTRPRGARPTIYDIAQLAGVNPSTVSRALSKPGRLNPKTEQLIREAAKALNYRVNPMARALPTGRTHTLGLIVADITNPMFFDVVRGAERAAAADGYTLVLAESQESGALEAETADRVAPSVDGLILVTTRLTDDEIRALAEQHPLVVINRLVDDVPSVIPEVAPGIDAALDHLAAVGHTSVAFLAGPERSWMSRARWDEIMARAVDRSLNIVEIASSSPTLDGGIEAFNRVRAAGVTAVVAYNDLMGIGLLRASQQAGLSVPGDLSIVGFDDIFGSDFTSPPLSTIRTPLNRLGELAVQRLLAQLGTAAAPDDVGALATEFIPRGSSGAPRGAGNAARA
ncbi:LacI family DNA-binding transcriptional regulator [Curtobacterium ammoniigenes]|uniref:LacI family DNA-binding transcriptional regulator n=1 Tax=Curtobacterium ammoniigenes TaxID=395387 RepID=UPI00082B6E04|nr:LacI family DNA-binding transcriptional regulator [Curtobacterium ammoniigenes]